MGFDPEKITFFAKTDARGGQVPFGIKAKDRQRHMYVVGKTGMGKSTLLENMAAQDIQNGEGMAFIDPHGSAAETLLDYVPEHRVNDVIYFAPFDMANPISFNVMEDVGADKRHLVVSGLMSTFKKIWVDAWSARMEYILTNALLVLIEYPETTLLSVNRLFSDKAYRKQVVEYCKDPAVKAFWTEEFANYTDRFAAEALPAIQNKIGQFTGNPLIRNIIGQPHSSFDIRKIMDEKKILIMNLSKGLVGETNANLLGSMLTTRIYLAAMSRADLPVAEMKKMPNFYFYVDEFQSFANATFANILSEARKYHLNLIIAHQYIAQMEEEVRDAVFGNVGTTVSFRVGPFDAEVLETVFTPRFLAADLVNLGFAQIYLTLMIDGIGSQPFSAVTLPPVEHPHVSCKDMVLSASRRNYTKDRDEVDKLVTDLHAPTVAPAGQKTEKKSDSSYNNKKTTNNYNAPAKTYSNNPTNHSTTGNNAPRSNTPSHSSNNRLNNVNTNTSGSNPNSKTSDGPNEKFAYKSKEEEVVKKSVATPMPVTPSPLEPKENQVLVSSPSKIEPTNKRESSLADLRSVLAGLSKADDSLSKKPDNDATKREERSSRDKYRSRNTPSSKEPANKEDLASILKNLIKVEEVPKTEENNNPTKETPVTPSPRQKDVDRLAEKKESKRTVPGEVVKTQSDEEKADVAKMSEETERAFSELESKSNSGDQLSTEKIQQMFKQPKNERSPFSS